MSKLIDFLTGGVGSEIVKGVSGFIRDQFPAKLSDADQAAIQIKLTEVANQQINRAAELAHQDQAEFNARIKEMEGTASDLRAIPILGPVILFLRGLQRPAWGFFTMYADWQWFTAETAYTEQQQTAMIVINMLVLTFLFGERAIKNLEPLIIKVFAKK